MSSTALFIKTLKMLEKESKVFNRKIKYPDKKHDEAEMRFFATISVLKELNKRYRAEDIEALQKMADAAHEFLSNMWYYGIKMLADGVDSNTIEELLWSKYTFSGRFVNVDESVLSINYLIFIRGFSLIPRKLPQDIFEECLRSLLPSVAIMADCPTEADSADDSFIVKNWYTGNDGWKKAFLSFGTAPFSSRFNERKARAKAILDEIK